MPLWTPDRLGPVRLLAWYTARDGDLIGTDNTTAVTSNGTAVRRWLDRSGNGRDANRQNAGSEPQYIASAVNGLPAVGDPSGSRNRILTLTPTLGTQYAAWYVGRVRAHVNFARVFGTDTSPGFGLQLWGSSGQVGARAENISAAQVGGNGVLSINAWAVIVLARTVSAGTASLQVWINGASVGTASGAAGTSAGTGGAIELGVDGAASDNTQGAEDDCVEFGLVDGPLTTDERQQIEGSGLWRIAQNANLAAGHPYQSSAPQFGGRRRRSFAWGLRG